MMGPDETEQSTIGTLFRPGDAPAPQLPAEGLKRHMQLGIRGATLGFGGTQIPPETLGESITEMVGQTPTVLGVSAVAGPVVGRLAPTLAAPAQRMIGATLTGASVGAAQAAFEGKPVLENAAKQAVIFGGTEGVFLGGAKLLKRALKTSKEGLPTDSSAAEPPVNTELSRGQGLLPETPPSLNLPVPVEGRIIDAKHWTGNGSAVLNPERNPQLRQGVVVPPSGRTRSMLPPGPETRALPPAYEEGLIVPPSGQTRSMLPPGAAGPRALGAAPERLALTGRPPQKALGPGSAPEPVDTDFGWQSFSSYTREFDDNINQWVSVPKTPEIEKAAQAALGVDPRLGGEVPLTEGQVVYLGKHPELTRKLDTNSQRMTTDEILKLPEDQAKAILDKGTPGPISAHSIELSPTGLEARELINRMGVAESEYLKFGATLRGTREQKLTQLRNWLQERCR